MDGERRSPCHQGGISSPSRADVFYADKKKLSGGNLSFVAQNASQPVLVNRKKYRGALTAVMTREKKRLTIVNTLPVEEYLYGVVAKEVIPLWPDEAIKAQAVAARSFALYHWIIPSMKGLISRRRTKDRSMAVSKLSIPIRQNSSRQRAA